MMQGLWLQSAAVGVPRGWPLSDFLSRDGSGERRAVGGKCMPRPGWLLARTLSLLLCEGVGNTCTAKLHGGPRHSNQMWSDSAYLTANLQPQDGSRDRKYAELGTLRCVGVRARFGVGSHADELAMYIHMRSGGGCRAPQLPAGRTDGWGTEMKGEEREGKGQCLQLTFHPSIHPSIHRSIDPAIHRSTSTRPSSIHPSIHPSIPHAPFLRSFCGDTPACVHRAPLCCCCCCLRNRRYRANLPVRVSGLCPRLASHAPPALFQAGRQAAQETGM